jgi:hypothetical protein
VDHSEEPAVIDMAQIELDRLLNCTVDELTALVKPLSANNCERYARAILGRIGGPSFEQLMIRIIQTAAPKAEVIHQGTQTHISLQFVSCSRTWQKTMMSLVGSFCSLCLQAHYGWRRTRL